MASDRPPRPRRGNAASDSAITNPNSGTNVGAGPITAPAPGDQDADPFGAVAELGGVQDMAAVPTNFAQINPVTQAAAAEVSAAPQAAAMARNPTPIQLRLRGLRPSSGTIPKVQQAGLSYHHSHQRKQQGVN